MALFNPVCLDIYCTITIVLNRALAAPEMTFVTNTILKITGTTKSGSHSVS